MQPFFLGGGHLVDGLYNHSIKMNAQIDYSTKKSIKPTTGNSAGNSPELNYRCHLMTEVIIGFLETLKTNLKGFSLGLNEYTRLWGTF